MVDMGMVTVGAAVIAAAGGASGLTGYLSYRRAAHGEDDHEAAEVIRAGTDRDLAVQTRLDERNDRLVLSLEKRIDQFQKEVERCEAGNLTRDETIEDLRRKVIALQAGQQAILDTIHDGVVLVNPAARITFANRALLQMVGWAAIDLIGEPIHSLVPRLKREEHRANVTNYLSHPTPRRMGVGLDLAIAHKDGHEIPVHISLSPQGSGEVLAIVHAS